MPRVARLHRPGERHHVTNRTSRKNPAFLDDSDRKFFLWLLSEMFERFEIEVEAFCFMTNHYHILFEGDLERLAKAMHRLGFLYTQYFNNRHELSGPLFSDRFYSSPVNDSVYHANVLRYIHRNPIAIDPNMDLSSYEWSSYGTYLGLRPRHWLPTAPGLALFDRSPELFRDFVEDPNNDVWIPTLADLHELVSAVTHVSLSEAVSYQPRRSNEALELFLILATELLETSKSEVARYAGLSGSTATRVLQRAQDKRVVDREFREVVQRSAEKLGPMPDLPSWWTDSWLL